MQIMYSLHSSTGTRTNTGIMLMSTWHKDCFNGKTYFSLNKIKPQMKVHRLYMSYVYIFRTYMHFHIKMEYGTCQLSHHPQTPRLWVPRRVFILPSLYDFPPWFLYSIGHLPATENSQIFYKSFLIKSLTSMLDFNVGLKQPQISRLF